MVDTSKDGKWTTSSNSNDSKPWSMSRPKDVTIESLRSLRTAMQFTVMDAKNRIVMLTGPMAGVGKSFLTVNLAVLLASSGKRVLMIDGDMRRGVLERYVGGAQDNGLSELLSGQISLEEAIRASNVEGLSFILSNRIFRASE